MSEKNQHDVEIERIKLKNDTIANVCMLLGVVVIVLGGLFLMSAITEQVG